MNIKITYNWLLEHLDTEAEPDEIRTYLSMCGPSIERVNEVDGDYVFDIEITSNRIDSASVAGIAQEASAILPMFNIHAVIKNNKEHEKPGIGLSKYPLVIEDKNKLCRRIMAVVMEIDEVKKSPEFIKRRLESCDVRSLTNIIDITNYVMLEMGHPTHVFDYDLIKTGKLVFRKAEKGEKLTTLDGKKHTLTHDDIVIDDGTGRIVDLPGIMGAQNTAVTDKTRRIVMFIESNDPKNIRRTSMRLALRSLAAGYNEKNPDPNLVESAFNRAVALIAQHAGGKIAGDIVDIYPIPVKPRKLICKLSDINRLIGIDIETSVIKNILHALNLAPVIDSDTLSVTVPTSRVADVFDTEDIVEEIARVYGYYRLPGIVQQTNVIKPVRDVSWYFINEQKIKYLLKHRAFHEVYNYSLVSKKLIDQSGLNLTTHLKLANPISNEIEYLRSTLVSSLLKNIKDNVGKTNPLRFFEVAHMYVPQADELPLEEKRLAMISTASFSEIKNGVEAVLHELNISGYRYQKGSGDNLFDVSNSLTLLSADGDILGTLGYINRRCLFNFDIELPVYAANLDMHKITSISKSISSYKPINPFSTIKLDLTIALNKNQSYQDVVDVIAGMNNQHFSFEYLSSYNNKVTLRFLFQATDRNLTEAEALKMLAGIKKKFTT